MKTLLTVILCFVCTLDACAQERASMAYEKMYGLFQKAAAVKNKDVRATIGVLPSNKGVKPGDVTLTIQAKGGAQKLTVDADGELHGFPMSDGLLKENPSVVTNQPKGSMVITAGLAFNLPDGTTFSYRQLGMMLDAANVEIKKQAGMLSFVAPQAKKITFEFSGPGSQTLTIGKKPTPLVLPVDGQGHIEFTFDPALLTENPTVTLSEKPSKALPDL